MFVDAASLGAVPDGTWVGDSLVEDLRLLPTLWYHFWSHGDVAGCEGVREMNAGANLQPNLFLHAKWSVRLFGLQTDHF